MHTEIHSLIFSDKHTLQVFQTKVLKISGPRRDEAVYDLVMREDLCNSTTTFVTLMK
jgi:hypothetical protein